MSDDMGTYFSEEEKIEMLEMKLAKIQNQISDYEYVLGWVAMEYDFTELDEFKHALDVDMNRARSVLAKWKTNPSLDAPYDCGSGV